MASGQGASAGQGGGYRRDFWLITLAGIAVIVGGFLLAYQFVQPAPPSKITISTGSESGAYFAFAKRYAAELAKNKITLEVRPSSGSVENAERLSSGAVQLALMQGGIADDKSLPGVVSLGRMFLEPIWVFYRGDERLDRLADLSGKRIAIGPSGSGTRKLATALLARNGVDEAKATLVPLGGQEAAEGLKTGLVDAIFLVVAPEAAIVQGLLRDPGAHLMSFAQADAYTRIFPYLSKVTLPQGVIDLGGNVPGEDVTLLAAQAALVARADLHPALVALMAGAAQDVHSGNTILHKANEFPKTPDPEFDTSDDAVRYYKSGPSFLMRHVPFWLAILLQRMIIMLVPIAGILVPALNIAPKLYQWRIRRRILRWYDKLKLLERRVASDRSYERLAGYREEIDAIDEAVHKIPVPMQFSDQLYSLRVAVDLVRQRIYSLG